LAPDINAMLDYREALGHSRKSQSSQLKSLDKFCADVCPEATTLTKDIVIGWLEEQHSGISQKATVARTLGEYLKAIGKDSYVLYQNYLRAPSRHPAYIFTDDELAVLFCAIDTTKQSNKEPFLHEIAPVLYRLIYTCGLRPNEGRELKCENINLKTGEALITDTKWKKERMVVMSGDMLSMCRLYDKRREIFARGSEYFFPSWKNGNDPFGNYQIGSYLRDAWSRANPNVPADLLPGVRVYDLRHRFASAALMRWLDAGVPLGTKLAYLRAYMGHSSLSETAL
jgi:integrase